MRSNSVLTCSLTLSLSLSLSLWHSMSLGPSLTHAHSSFDARCGAAHAALRSCPCTCWMSEWTTDRYLINQTSLSRSFGARDQALLVINDRQLVVFVSGVERSEPPVLHYLHLPITSRCSSSSGKSPSLSVLVTFVCFFLLTFSCCLFIRS